MNNVYQQGDLKFVLDRTAEEPTSIRYRYDKSHLFPHVSSITNADTDLYRLFTQFDHVYQNRSDSFTWIHINLTVSDYIR